MNKQKIFKLFLIMVILLPFMSCSKKFKHPVISNLKKSSSVKLDNNILSISFNNNDLDEVSNFTKKDFYKYNIIFTPLRKFNLQNSISIYLHYKSKNNHIRFNIFLDTGKIHLYEVMNNKIKTLIYLNLRSKYNINENNIYEINVSDNKMSLKINNQQLFNDQIDHSFGKVGVGAYGKKGDQVQFVFRQNNEK